MKAAMIVAVALCLAAPCAAQSLYDGPKVDTAAAAQAAAAKATADAAKAKADAAAATLATVQANMPVASTSIPSAETVGGAVGTPGVYIPQGASVPRIGRTDRFAVAGSTGMLTVTWTNPLPATYGSQATPYANYPVYFTPIGAVNTAPDKWKVISASNTGFTAQCYREVTAINLTLSGLTNASVTGLSLPVSGYCPAGTEVFAQQLPSAK